MTITFTSEIEGDLLVVTTQGIDDDLHQVIDYGQAVIDLAVRSGTRRVLCDERNLVYTLGTTDTFELARTIVDLAPAVGRVAIVCRPPDFEDGKFWETVATNRGLRVRAFLDVAQARAWLEMLA